MSACANGHEWQAGALGPLQMDHGSEPLGKVASCITQTFWILAIDIIDVLFLTIESYFVVI